MIRRLPLVFLLLSLPPAAASAQLLEVEPNDSKPTATIVSGLASGGTIDGLTTGADATGGTTSADYFRIRLATPGRGIWRHTLTLTASPMPVPDNPGHTLTIRGLGQAASVILGTDVAVQTAPAFHPFIFGYRRQAFCYSVGQPAEIYCSVTGTAATTAPYRITLLTEPAALTDLGVFAPGTLTIESTSLSAMQAGNDSDFWVYDGNLQAIVGYGNDDRLTPTPNKAARLVRSFGAGTYYLAATHANLANDQSSPVDDGRQAGHVLDFPNVVATSKGGTLWSFNLAVSDGARTETRSAGSFMLSSEILWYRLQIASTCTPPAFTLQPVSTTVCVGQPATFLAGAAGTAPLAYQWRYNTQPIALANGPTLVIPGVELLHAGTYDVVVTNACGQVTSAPVVLSVQPAGPLVTKDPESVTVCPGRLAAFEVVATPRRQCTLGYQWRKDGNPIAGATAASYSFVVAGIGDAGQYDCVVTEACCGSTTSAPAVLTVRNAPPVITLTGPQTVVLECHRDAYNELGATAVDDCDGTVAVTIGGDTVDTRQIGTYAVTYDVRDSQGNWAATVRRSVVVQDTTPPAVDLATATRLLWPANHKLVHVGLAAAVTDACDRDAASTLQVRIFANELELPTGGDGTGLHAPDAADLAPATLRLRSERRSPGDGRIYLIVARANDASGNAGFGLSTIVVPHDLKQDALAALQQRAAATVVTASAGIAPTATIDDLVTPLRLQGWSEHGLSERRGPWQ